MLMDFHSIIHLIDEIRNSQKKNNNVISLTSIHTIRYIPYSYTKQAVYKLPQQSNHRYNYQIIYLLHNWDTHSHNTASSM